GKKRFKEEGEGLRREKEYVGYSYEALRKLQQEGIIKDIIEDDKVAEGNYRTVEGNFADLHYVLNNYMVNWEKKFQESQGEAEVDPRTFFNNSNPEYAFANEHDIFEDIAFDVVLFNWHTFCEVGGPEQQREVLNIYQCANFFNFKTNNKYVKPRRRTGYRNSR
ncbi:MAG TPA: hypothetical protein PLS49_08335, partial [Candidatus Woesebacteria bacterium]|nr:hypothetical protein [Candidatus Woesebacteria bacterium]